MQQTIHQKLVDRVDAVRNGRTWKAVCAEIGVGQGRMSAIRWQTGKSFSIETYKKIEDWVKREEANRSWSESMKKIHITG